MKKLLALTIAVGLTGAVFAVPATSQDIIVQPQHETVTAYAEDVSQDLDKQLDRLYVPIWMTPRGVVQVRFERGQDGNAENVTLYRRSGNITANRTALRAVRKLKGLGPIPVEAGPDSVIQANIIFAASRKEFEKYSEQLAEMEAERLAGRSEKRTVLAFNMVR